MPILEYYACLAATNSTSDSFAGQTGSRQEIIDGGMCSQVACAFHIKYLYSRALVFTSESGTKSWCGSAAGMDTQRKSLLDGCDEDWEFSADLPEWNNYPRYRNKA
ncbi:reverse transcriptase [Plakobranchus ocellatus]|uniref:Reverse transcriptase n=1 Tax=Plakobranchus ocellatus TaxID=259542 RepID=A0AAV4D3W8_9GAST|nr:reverse transcriptase [Plakobranchus ocellatus]